MIKYDEVISKCDGLKLDIAYIVPEGEVLGVIQLSHGMAEHKERYFDFMKFLASNGYACVINDHRGHGKSIKSNNDLGYFYTDNIDYIVDDLHEVTLYIKNKFKNKKIYLFSHSMGTLVSRCYMEKYDFELEKLILCGAPTYNPFTPFAIALSYTFKFFGLGKKKNKFLNTLTFGNYNKGYKDENSWLSKNTNNISVYNDDELCGFIFTTNGFINLYKLMRQAFKKNDYQVKNKNLDILLIAGSDDPVIQNEKKFIELKEFLKDMGYKNIECKLYKNLRHEILNEKTKKEVYNDILNFINKY